MHYWPHGAIYYYGLGNGITHAVSFNKRLQQTESYDAINNLDSQMLFISCPNWGNPTSTMPWLFDKCPHTTVAANNGNLTAYDEYHAGGGSPSLTFHQDFTYDGANRLTKASEGGWSRTFNYDPFGNMWVTSVTGLATGAYTNNVYGANNRVVNAPYDAAGNLLLANGNTLSYDAENHQVTATEPPAYGGGIEQYLYDSSGQRVAKSGPSGTTIYVYDAMGQLAAEYSTATPPASPCATCYLATDHLGSTRLITDQNANVISRHDFFPFGEEILAGQAGRDSHFGPGNDSINQKFTGKERDAESGLDYFGARYYGGAGGRFTSVDPENAGADSANPQSWNGYSYVQNNPLALTDPDGRAAKDPCDGIPNCVSVSAKYEGLDPLSAAVYQGLFRPVTQMLLFTQQTIQGLQWLGKPRNSTCLAASTAAGASAGAGVGALGLVGGPAVGITEPTAVLAGGVAGWAGGMVSCMSSSEGSGGGGSSEGGVAGNLKKLSPSEIKKLKVAGEDAEQIKKEIVGARGSNYDLFKTESGEIVVKAKDGLGEAQPTGLNIRKY